MAVTSLAGRLVVASPRLRDPNFDRAVVLVLQHDGDGALGLVLNRPSTTEIEPLLPGWRDVVTGPARFFVGGPCEPDAAICLGLLADPAESAGGFAPAVGLLGTLDLDGDPADAARLAGVRVFAGYSGWGPGQLEAELAEGAWVVVDLRPADAFADEPEALWRAVLRRQPGPLALLATYAEDPTLN